MRNRTLTASAILVISICGICLAAGEPSVLDRLKGGDRQVVIQFKETDLSLILKALGGAGEFAVKMDTGLRDRKVSVEFKNVTIRVILDRLAREQSLEYEVPAADVLVVKPRKG